MDLNVKFAASGVDSLKPGVQTWPWVRVKPLGTIQSDFYWVGYPPLEIGMEMVGNDVILLNLE